MDNHHQGLTFSLITKMKSLITFCLFLITPGAFGQSEQKAESLRDTINFYLTEDNNISVDAIINDADTVSLMFHTAVNSVSLTPDQTKRLTENIDKKSSDVTTWTDSKSVEYIEKNKLNISKLEWDNLIIWLNMLSGKKTDGKFGPNLFAGRLIEIDFDNEIIVLHGLDENSFDLNKYQTFDLSTNESNSLFIEGEILVNDVSYTSKFMVHSGYGGTIILDDAFCRKYEALKATKVIEEKELKDSFGNIIKTKRALAKEFQVCNTAFSNVPYSYFDSELAIQETSVLGGEIIKRFNMLIDVENLKLHVQPNKFTDTEFKSSEESPKS